MKKIHKNQHEEEITELTTRFIPLGGKLIQLEIKREDLLLPDDDYDEYLKRKGYYRKDTDFKWKLVD